MSPPSVGGGGVLPLVAAVAALAVLSTSAFAAGAADPLFPMFHVRPETNWINDPNGPLYDPRHDRYHLWMQYNPAAAVWGNMSWYHVVSDDLVYFRRIGVSLANDARYDVGGVFSGSVTLTHGWNPVIFYTCVNATSAQKQCAAVPADRNDPDLVQWTKLAANPVIEAGPAVQRGDTNFRDPTTAWWVAAAQTFRFAVGTSVLPNLATVALYDTPTLTDNFTFAGVLTQSAAPRSSMYECPDYFPLQPIALVPEATSPNRFLFKESDEAVFQDFFTIGSNDDSTAAAGNSQTFSAMCYADVSPCPAQPGPGETNSVLVDFGGWYASKTFWDGKRNRRVLWGWIQEDGYSAPDWAGAQSLPRLVQYDPVAREMITPPLPELAALRRAGVAVDGLSDLRLQPNAMALVFVTTGNGIQTGGSYAAALMPQMEVLVSFTVGKTLVDQAQLLQVGLDVMYDGPAFVANASVQKAAFIGVTVDRRYERLTAMTQPGGADYRAITVAGATRADRETACQATCTADRRCVAWNYNDAAGDQQCSLKSRISVMAPVAAGAESTTGRPGQPLFGVWRDGSGTAGSSLPRAGRAQLRPSNNGSTYTFTMQVFVDRSVVEAFKDGGRERVATRVYNANATSLASAAYRVQGITDPSAAGAVTLDYVGAWEVGSIWTKPPATNFNPPSGTVAILIAAGVVAALLVVLSLLAARVLVHERAAAKPKQASDHDGSYAEFVCK